ncbi:nucleotidyltransferase family protein [Natronorarus salvus]|uniref:nucleotidyltransferase family protein n=1 Tax=Natronorarus salvus TaxID=3117733 RepID=UPI002F26CBA0
MDALGLVTAAGKSTRMGGFPKPLLWFGEDRFVERIVGTYQESGVDNQLVVLGYEAETVNERAELASADSVYNENFESGMLSSVQIGVHHAKTLGVEGMFLWPVDFPCVTSDIAKQLWQRFQDTDADIAVPAYQGDRGHPALFGRSTFTKLLEAPETEGARAVVYSDEIEVVEVEVSTNRILVDIDTPTEYWDAVKNYEPDYSSDRQTVKRER